MGGDLILQHVFNHTIDSLFSSLRGFHRFLSWFVRGAQFIPASQRHGLSPRVSYGGTLHAECSILASFV